MIFRRPDAFFIKHIKLIHGIILLCMIYLLFRTSSFSDFYEHVVSVKSIVGESNLSELFNTYMFVAIIISLLLTIVILVLLVRKQKKFVFYILTIILLSGLLIFYIMAYNNINVMQKNVVDAPIYLAYNDVSKILFYSQAVFLLIFLFRAVGFDFKTFSFNKNILGLDLTEADSEEVEFNLEIDRNEIKTKRRRRLREAKYSYVENKFKINLIVSLILVITGVIIINSYKSNKETFYSLKDEFNFYEQTIKIDEVYVTNLDYNNEIISENDFFVILDVYVKKNFNRDISFNSNGVSVLINDEVYYNIEEQIDLFSDFGTPYKNQKLTTEYKKYYLVYKIPYEFSTDTIYIKVNNGYSMGDTYKIKTNYKRITNEEKKVVANLTEKMEINARGISMKFVINDVEIKEKFKFNYAFNHENKTFDSVEYLVPTIDDDVEKTILKIKYEVESENNKINLETIINKYGKIEYEKEEKIKESKIYSFIKPLEIKEENVYYIQVAKDVLNGKNRKLKFKIRDYIYEYNLDLKEEI